MSFFFTYFIYFIFKKILHIKESGATPSKSAGPASSKVPATPTVSSTTPLTPESQDIPVVFDVNLQVRKGQLVAVCGAVAAGKSSLLSGILGRMKVSQGSVTRVSSVAYVAQQAWIQTQSLKQNILFDKV